MVTVWKNIKKNVKEWLSKTKEKSSFHGIYYKIDKQKLIQLRNYTSNF